MQQFSSLYVVLIAIGGALVALAIYHAAVLRPAIDRMQALVAVHDDLISGGAGGASERLAALENADVSIQAALEAAQTRVATLEAFSASDVSRCGFVRYDAFADAESGLSYALALLNFIMAVAAASRMAGAAATRCMAVWYHGVAMMGVRPHAA